MREWGVDAGEMWNEDTKECPANGDGRNDVEHGDGEEWEADGEGVDEEWEEDVDEEEQVVEDEPEWPRVSKEQDEDPDAAVETARDAGMSILVS